MASIIEEIYDANQKIKAIEHDSGSEFIGQEFKRVLMDHDIDNKQYPRAENSKTALSKVERLNGTIRGWWNRYFRGRMSPDEAIPLIQEKYNATKHRTTKQEPQHITTKREYAKVRLEDELRGTEARNNISNNFHEGLHEEEEGYEWWWLPSGGRRDVYPRLYFEHDTDAQMFQSRLGNKARLVFEESPDNDHVRYYRIETSLTLKQLDRLMGSSLFYDCCCCWGFLKHGGYRDPPEPIETAPGSVQMAV